MKSLGRLRRSVGSHHTHAPSGPPRASHVHRLAALGRNGTECRGGRRAGASQNGLGGSPQAVHASESTMGPSHGLRAELVLNSFGALNSFARLDKISL